MDYTAQFEALYQLLTVALVGGLVSAVCICVALGVLVVKALW